MKQLLLGLLMLTIAGCDGMEEQPRLVAQEPSVFFADGKVNQAPPAGTVARGDAQWRATLAERPAMSKALLERGRERFDIFCSPCHGVAGDGQGTVVERGFPQPPDLASPRLATAPDEHLLAVIAEGYGIMYGYAARVRPADRWAIVAYIRALQLSRQASPGSLPAQDRAALEALR